jgi:hypothetical protein
MGYVEASIGQAFKQEFLFSFKNKYAVLIKGTKSATRLSNSPTALYTQHDLVQDSGLVKLTVQEGRDRRYVWLVQRVGSTQAEAYPPECEIKGKIDHLENGIQKLTFTRPLTSGEYSLIASDSASRQYLVYAFAIE